MSTPSKRRAAARAWMHAERERSERERARLESDAKHRVARVDANWRRRVELVVPADDDSDVFYPQGKLERPFMQVYAPLHRPPRLFDPTNHDDLADAFRYATRAHLEVVSIRAVQMAHRLSNGRTIMWWTWEIGR